jgi:methylmalonyl-CoA/ethylmalonyl-CoA epimerase
MSGSREAATDGRPSSGLFCHEEYAIRIRASASILVHPGMKERLMQNAISRIGQISLTVTDLARAVAFYRDTLGLTLLFEVPGMAFFACGGVRIMLTLPEQGKSPQNSVLYFVVEEIEAHHALLRDRGVKFLREPHFLAKMPDHELWMAFFEDPDANVMALMCEKR